MYKNPGLWLVVMIVVVGYNLYGIFGPQDEAPSQGLLILNWVLIVCGVAGLIGAGIQLTQHKNREGA
ncbi:MAG TPA: hypothetical protein VNV38_02395 [Stellaceae bacterium]|jgi:hypothetical protein|nr:hypothetical protein [Stellaceae bacterium]